MTTLTSKKSPSRKRFLIVTLMAVALVVVVAAVVGLVIWPRSNSNPITAAVVTPSGGETGGQTDTETLVQKSEGGQVTITATRQQQTGSSGGISFMLVMDTHSVDLDGYDLRQIALLRTDQGREVQPDNWNAPKGGHHRQGLLTFPNTTPDGRPIIEPGTRTLALVIRGVGGLPERIMRWAL